jgi:glycosyltransferase involved in cell wall biosynthesis
VFLVSTLRRAGPTSVLLNIVQYLDPRLFDPVIVTLSPEPAESMIDAFRETTATIRSLSMSRVRALFHRGWRRDIERLVGAELDRHCVVHSHGIRCDVISAKKLAGVARVTTAHTYPYDDYLPKYGPLMGRWMTWKHLRALRASPVVVACSSTLSDKLRCHAITAMIIRNGVDTSKFCAALPQERARLRFDLGLPETACIGVSVGAMSVRKQPLSIVQAARAVDNPSLLMIFVGTGNLEARCRREAQGDERIRFVGQVAEPTPYLRAADFFISASRSEGLPIASLEAISCGLHVVLSDIGPHRELLELAPGVGEMFAVGDLHALTAAVKRVTWRARGPTSFATESMGEILGAKYMSECYQELYLRLGNEALAGHDQVTAQ